MLKKIDRNCFLCYKKSFLSYSIFNLHWTEQQLGCYPFARRALPLQHTLYIRVKRFSQLFSDFFRNFFRSFRIRCIPSEKLPSRSDSLSIITYSLYPCQAFFTTFFGFFGIFSDPFGSLHSLGDVILSLRQLGYSIIPLWECQLFFATFLSFFGIFLTFF